MSSASATDSNDQTAGPDTGPAVVVADPLTPTFRALLNENKRLRREAGRLWLKAHTPAERHEFLLARLDRVAELEAADERGDLATYYDRVLASFEASMADIRKPADAYVAPRAA